METKEIKINVPEGYEIDQENSTFECIKFKPVKLKLPKTWEEFCKSHPRRVGEYYLTGDSSIHPITVGTVDLIRKPDYDKNVLPSKELAKAMLALCQLIQLRDCYNDGWTPDWTDLETEKYCINFSWDRLHVCICCYEQQVLVFKTEKLRSQFLENFRDLIETAKPLL